MLMYCFIFIKSFDLDFAACDFGDNSFASLAIDGRSKGVSYKDDRNLLYYAVPRTYLTVPAKVFASDFSSIALATFLICSIVKFPLCFTDKRF